jgi:hypothetical protein
MEKVNNQKRKREKWARGGMKYLFYAFLSKITVKVIESTSVLFPK